jgi:UDP-glucose 4-epimerase
MNNSIIVSGGLGFIGSHMVIHLCNSGYSVVIVDTEIENKDTIIKNINKCIPDPSLYSIYSINILDIHDLSTVFKENNVSACFHFAALKSVSESIEQPYLYYHNNITGLLNILECCATNNCTHFIYSSSATVYGNQPSPLYEYNEIGKNITNPYGQTKYMGEQIIQDFSKVYTNTQYYILRYFNPIGAHPSGNHGELYKANSTNIMPVLHKCILENKTFTIYGNNYNTKDGTPIRDYIHIMDLVDAHLLCIENKKMNTGIHIYNIGSGSGYTVLELIKSLEEVSNKQILYAYNDRRPGDIDIVYANTDKINKELGWSPKYTLKDMCTHFLQYIY